MPIGQPIGHHPHRHRQEKYDSSFMDYRRVPREPVDERVLRLGCLAGE